MATIRKRYELKAKDRGQVKTFGRVEMVNQATCAELYLYGDIVDDELTAAWFGGNYPQEIADFVAGLSPNQPLTIYFNSPGGDVFAGLAIYNVLKRHQGRKTGKVDGMAASIASVIRRRRYMVASPTRSSSVLSAWVKSEDRLREKVSQSVLAIA